MASILSDNPFQASEQQLQNPVISVNNIIGQILGSANPQAVFNQIVANNPEAKKAMAMAIQELDL